MKLKVSVVQSPSHAGCARPSLLELVTSLGKSNLRTQNCLANFVESTHPMELLND